MPPRSPKLLVTLRAKHNCLTEWKWFDAISVFVYPGCRLVSAVVCRVGREPLHVFELLVVELIYGFILNSKRPKGVRAEAQEGRHIYTHLQV